MIVGFTGTRQGPTPAQHRMMDRVLLHFAVNSGMKTFVHGGAIGCDTFAHHVVTASGLNREILVEILPADNPGSTVWIPMGNCIIYERMPPLERNRIIVRRIHGLIATPKFFREDSSGTWATIRYAREIGCPVYIITERGEFVRDKSTYEKWSKPL